MPELPEVETVKNTLIPIIKGKKINDCIVRYSKIIANVSVDQFKKALTGNIIIDIKRKGKYLIFSLNDYYLIAHLRMEGKFFKYEDNNYEKHDHIIFMFDTFNIRYNDTRRFGKMYIFPSSVDIDKVAPLNKVGLEPFAKDMSVEYLKSKFKNSNKPIKSNLLDQSIMAGLGNIYVDEVLFLSKIHPNEKTNKLTNADLQNIITNSCGVLTKAISLGGTTIKSFKSARDISGRFQNELLVHTKEECPICHGKIEKIRVGGRGTYFCPNCQKIKA